MSTSISVTAAPSPLQVSASASPTSGKAPLAVNFTGTASGGVSPYIYSWAFGDGSTSTAQNPTHSYLSIGSYASTLTVIDSSSSKATSTVNITVSSTSSYSLSIASETGAPAPGQGGTTDPSPGTYSYSIGSSVLAKSLVNTDYRFSKWSGDVVETSLFDLQTAITIDKNKSVAATFCTKCGDVNGDLKITPADAQAAFDIFLGRIPNPTWCEKENADVNSSGAKLDPKVTPADAQAIFRKFLKKGELPNNCSGASRTLEAATSFLSMPSGEVNLVWNEPIASQNGDLVLPVIIDSSFAIGAFGFDLQFPPEDLAFIRVETSDFSERFYQVGAHETAPGVIRVGGYASQPVQLKGPAVLVTLLFSVTGSVPGQDSISITNACDDLHHAQIQRGTIRQNTERKNQPAKEIKRDRLLGKKYDH
jgi:PKD repeat protein